MKVNSTITVKKAILKFDINKYPKFKDKIIYIVQDEEPPNLETVKKEDDEGVQNLINLYLMLIKEKIFKEIKFLKH